MVGFFEINYFNYLVNLLNDDFVCYSYNTSSNIILTNLNAYNVIFS